MDNRIKKVLNGKSIKAKIQEKLPKLFYLAEIESSRAGKVGMEVGSLRERIIVALLIYRFGEKNVNSKISITEPETDVIVYNTPISIKTMTSKKVNGFKISWTVDPESAIKFSKNYSPECDMIYVQINWTQQGHFFYIPKEIQKAVLYDIGRTEYIKLPKIGTNPRGVEISTKALRMIVEQKDTIKIPIHWEKEIIDYDPFERWVELWQQD